jgi:hypothetical protein
MKRSVPTPESSGEEIPDTIRAILCILKYSPFFRCLNLRSLLNLIYSSKYLLKYVLDISSTIQKILIEFGHERRIKNFLKLGFSNRLQFQVEFSMPKEPFCFIKLLENIRRYFPNTNRSNQMVPENNHKLPNLNLTRVIHFKINPNSLMFSNKRLIDYCHYLCFVLPEQILKPIIETPRLRPQKAPLLISLVFSTHSQNNFLKLEITVYVEF